MKKEMLLIMISFFLISLTTITGVYAIEENTKTVTISKQSADLTGDGQNETILLKGVPDQEQQDYLKRIFIEVLGSNGRTYSFPLESGSKASLKLVDLNHDGLKDVFANVLTNSNQDELLNYLYSLKDFVRTDLTVPDPLEMDAKFKNGYKAEIKLSDNGKTYLFDLKDRKDYYKKLGFYYHGKLNEPMELTVNPFNRMEVVQIDKQRIGLKGQQLVTGIANADTIASVNSIWYYDKGQWKLYREEVKAS
ncbi:hypothetical protein [Neobacillus cucumis]|uniref:hypothetical protein n=1 Tax=Neobacillus cucumis TaxID=1740721 RepID=UPI0028533A8A|nr:hypothetical protein [Neobacillus cucumis]MDR4947475.1 hypothetical protein [Neobacillus cucumis]